MQSHGGGNESCIYDTDMTCRHLVYGFINRNGGCGIV